jgi:hypothetical protein
MANFVLNGVTFSGHPSGSGNQSAWLPTSVKQSETKIGATLVAADGTRNRVERNVTKRVWEITWQETNTATMQTVRTIQRLMTTFTLTDLESASYTVQCEDEEFSPEFAFSDPSGNNYWDVTLKVFQV